jgi:hypothetical protein
MDHMSPDQQPASSTPPGEESVLEFGTEPAAPAGPPRRRWNLTGAAASLAGDRRVVPLSAVLGGVALFASLISEWQVTLVDTSVFGATEAGLLPVPTDLGDLGSWGAGYLAGLVALVPATVLVLFGPPPGRRYARLLGLSTGGMLLGLLAALEPTLNGVSRTMGYVLRFQPQLGRAQVTTGRGIWCAIAGVVAVMLALYLAGRHAPRAAAERLAADDDADEPEAVWSWRRPAEPDEDRPPADPFDLTVTSTRPFTSLDDDRDKSD